MAQAPDRQDDKPALELLEEAVQLVRGSPGASLAAYYVGSLPFVLGALYFWADMSRSALAEQRLAEASGGLAGLLVWMKCWQGVFMRGLLARLCGQTPPRWTLRRVWRLALTQAAIQPAGLFVLTAAALCVFPMPWAYAYYQNACLLGDGDTRSTIRGTLRGAWRQAALWPGQNSVALLALSVFTVLVLANIASAILTPSFLLKTFLDVDTVFSRGGFQVLNTTFLAVLFGLAYLCIDPVVKAMYTLRCFYGRSRQTGQDLQAELKHLAASQRPTAAAMLLAAGLAVLAGGACPARASGADPVGRVEPAAARRVGSESRRAGKGRAAHGTARPRRRRSPPSYTAARTQPWHPSYGWADTAAAPRLSPAGERAADPDPTAIGPQDLDESMRRVISRREYDWRMPRKASEGQGKVRGFLESVQTSVREWWRNFVKWLREDDDKPKKRKVRLDDEQPPAPSGGGGWVALMQPIMYGLIGACVIVLAVLLWQTYRKRRAEEPQEAEGSVAAAPDIADEDVAAGDLPESGWMDMAGQLLAAGDRRLALRALYLASLVRLARRGLLAIARFKSNGDYRREVQRRAHALPQVADAFRQNVVFFEDAWYGQHDVTDGIVRAFVGNQERIRGGDEA